MKSGPTDPESALPEHAGLPQLDRGGADEALGEALAALQGAVLRHPVAAQAAFAALVAEGRRHAATTEGAILRRRLAGSALLRRVRSAWEIGTFNLLDPDPTGPFPSDLVDVVLMAASDARPVLGRLFGDPDDG